MGPSASMNPPLKFAFSDYGGIGFEFYSTVVKPHFEELREKEEAAGGSGWDAAAAPRAPGPTPGRTQEEVGVPAESRHHNSQG
jgi:hypothetical protein